MKKKIKRSKAEVEYEREQWFTFLQQQPDTSLEISNKE